MGYVVMTAKHHEGFALYSSDVSSFNVVDGSPFKRDVIKELSKACQRQGLKFGIYYSQAQDWDDPNSSFDTRFHQRDIHPDLPHDFEPDIDRYIVEKALPQVEELVKNYEIDLIWFDTPKDMTYERAVLFRDVIRKHRPDCLINSRLITWGIGQIEQKNLELFDYASIGDLEVPDQKLPIYFESPDSVGSFYGYKCHGDYSYHTPKELIHRMVLTICSGGNYLLNNGPKPTGRLDPEAVRLYGIIGEWTKLNRESLISTRANPFDERPPWGHISVSRSGDLLYLHILDWPESGRLELQGLYFKVSSATFLADDTPANFNQTGETLSLSLPSQPVCEHDTVIKLIL
jgi:alpha-L-fucosidase